MFRKIFANFILVIFVILSVPSMLVLGIYNTVSDENFYKGEVVDAAYTLVVDALPKALISGMNESKEPLPFDEETLRGVFLTVVKKEDLATVMDSFVTQFKSSEVTTVEGKGNVIKFNIPLGWFAAKQKTLAQDLAAYFYDNLQPCKDKNNKDFSPTKINCIPKGVSKAVLENELKRALSKQLPAIPNNFQFEAPASKFPKGNVSSYVGGIAGLVFKIAGTVLLFLLFLIGLITFRPWASILNIESRALFWSTFYIGVVLAALYFIPHQVVKFAQPQGDFSMYLNVYKIIISAIISRLSYIIVPVFVLSLAGRIVGHIYEKRSTVKASVTKAKK